MRTAAAYDDDEIPSSSAELSLGMGTILGIFFALALVCGLFFGFGYTIGHRTPGPYVSSEPLYEAPKVPAPLAAPKPSALVPEPSAITSQVVLPATAASSVVSTPARVEGPTSAPVTPAQIASAPIIAPKSGDLPSVSKGNGSNLVPEVLHPTIATGAFMVQIAAVKNRTDAEALANALRKNGFTAAIRSESQDKLLHVQVGPFGNRDDAKAMRQKLSNAGYDAFIK